MPVKLREIEISVYSPGIMAVFSPANRDKEGYLRIAGINASSSTDKYIRDMWISSPESHSHTFMLVIIALTESFVSEWHPWLLQKLL